MRLLFSLIIFLLFRLTCSAQPPNNNCSGATQLVVDAPCVSGTNVNATADGNPSCGLFTFYADMTVWYSFVATGPNTQISVTNVSGNLDVIMTLYNLCGSGSFKCVNATGNNENESVVQNTVSGNTYWISIDGSGAIWPFTGNEDGNFCIQVSTYIAPPNPSGDCAGAQPFCTGTTYQFPAGTNTQSQSGPNYGCLLTQPNPAWYYLKISQNGPIDIHMASDANVDIDFICWGPFTSETDACTQISAGGGGQVDCSYSTAAEEDCNIPNAQVGEYYMLLITNYSNQPTNIIFSQTGGSGATDCSIINPIIAINNGPFCPGQTLQLNATDVPNATYSWSGPNGFTSAIRNPAITNLTVAASGVYTLTTTINSTVYTSTTTVTVFAANSPDCFQGIVCTINATVSNDTICTGESADIQGLGTIGTAVLSNTFNNGTVGVGWVGTPTANFSNPPCASAPPYGTTFLWMDNTTPAPRNLESNDFNVQFGGQISFWMKYAVQGQGVPCEGPDEGGEGVTLQYSTTNGTSWTDIVYFSPNGTQMATNPDPGYTNHATVYNSSSPFLNWARYSFAIPAGGWTTSTRFRWMQYHSTDAVTDNWGIDSVLIITPPQAVTITWTSNPPGFSQTGNGPFTVSPAVTTDYIATISDGTNTCSDTVKVVMYNVSAGFTVNDSVQCLNNNSFIFTNQGPVTNATFSWNFGDGAVSALMDPVHGYTNTGTYIVTQTVQVGSCVDSVKHTVRVTAHPTLAIDSTASCTNICNGSLTANPSGAVSPYSFQWSSGLATQTITNVCSGSYNVTVTDALGCASSKSATVALNPAPTVNTDSIPSCRNFCNGSVTATGSGTTAPYTYAWSTGAATATISNLCTGIYIVTVTDVRGCTVTGNNIVSYYPGINVAFSRVNVRCNGENNGSATATGSGGGGNGFFSYQWDVNTGSQTTATASGLQAGTYRVVITDNIGCSLDTAITVIEPLPLIVTAGPDTHLCYHMSGMVYAFPAGGIAPYTFFWNGDSSQSFLTVTPELSTSYTVFVTDSNNCISNSDITYVTVDPKLKLSLYPEDSIVCPGEQAVINLISEGGDNGPYLASEYEGSYFNPPYKIIPTGSPQQVVIGIKDFCGATAFDTATLYLHPVPEPFFFPNVNEGCMPLTVYFNDATDTACQVYSWNFSDEAGVSASRNPVHTFEDAGVFDISLTVTSFDNCTSSISVPECIRVYQKPEAKFMYLPDNVSVLQSEVTFTNLSTDYAYSIWHFDDGDSSMFDNPVHSFKLPKTYEIKLTAVSEHGCKDTVTQKIYVKDEVAFYAPSAFSPDADGVNDVYYVYGYGINPSKFVLYIYDRWGQVLFETRDITQGWDGKVSKSISGRDVVKNDVYTWFAAFSDMRGVVHQRTGSITVIH